MKTVKELNSQIVTLNNERTADKGQLAVTPRWTNA